MAKHKVEVVESFTHSREVGALTVGGQEIAPPTVVASSYTAGQLLEFSRKKDAEAFVTFHGSKVRLLGK